MRRFLALVLLFFGLILLIISLLLLHFQKNTSLPITTKGIRLKTPNENIDEYISSQMKLCFTDSKYTCYQDVATILMRQFSLPQILSVFKKNQQRPEIFALCHETTHFLARIEYENKKNIGAVYNECTPICQGGCYHGTIEAYFKDKQIETSQSDMEIMKNFIPLVCGKEKSYKIPRVYSECVHGIGHAAMYVNNNNVPVALKACDSLSTVADRETCYGGVFMESFSSSTNDLKSGYTKADDPLYPCDILDKKYLSSCYTYQSSYFAILAYWDWRKVSQLCLKVPDEYQHFCFRVIGANQTEYTQDISVIKKECEQLPSSSATAACIAGVVDSFAGRFINDISRIKAFCTIVEDKFKPTCYKQMGTSISSWSNRHDNVVRICSSLPAKDEQNWCINH